MNQVEFDQAWREFADQDAQAAPSAGVRREVMAAWDTAQRERVRPQAPERGAWLALAAVAATITLALASAMVWRGSSAPQRDSDAAALKIQQPIADSAQGPVIRLAADQAFENEPLTIVRVRVPRSSLTAMGIALVEPEASSLVELEVVVGSDGLPQAIQRVRFVLDGKDQ